MRFVERETLRDGQMLGLAPPTGGSPYPVAGKELQMLAKISNDELLGLRSGVRGYVEKRLTMGIPFLHPWANRLSGFDYSFDGSDVALSEPEIYLDGLQPSPI